MRDLAAFFQANPLVVRVVLSSVKGSTPREEGALMFVSNDAIAGTIGGGNLEYMAIDEARVMMCKGRASGHMSIPLGPEIGQCCGGYVEVSLAIMDQETKSLALVEADAVRDAYPTVVVFGSGHVGRALADILAGMPVRTVLVDDRREELELCQAPVLKRCTPLPEQEVRRAPPGSAFVIATNDHAVDFLIATEALERRDCAYLGMIGSRTKRVSFERWYAKNVDRALSPDRLMCPIGSGGSQDKRPEVIAVFVAAEVLARLTENNEAHFEKRRETESVGGQR